jgi:hypothetical protein
MRQGRSSERLGIEVRSPCVDRLDLGFGKVDKRFKHHEPPLRSP